MLTQVILRYVFSSGLSWGEEITRYTMIWVAMLSGSILVKNRELIKVDFLDTLWSPRFIKCRDIVSHFLFVCAYLVIIIQGWKQAHYALTAGSRMISVDANFFWAYLAMPVGAAIMAVQLILSIVLKILSEKNSDRSEFQRKAASMGLAVLIGSLFTLLFIGAPVILAMGTSALLYFVFAPGKLGTFAHVYRAVLWRYEQFSFPVHAIVHNGRRNYAKKSNDHRARELCTVFCRTIRGGWPI